MCVCVCVCVCVRAHMCMRVTDFKLNLLTVYCHPLECPLHSIQWNRTCDHINTMQIQLFLYNPRFRKVLYKTCDLPTIQTLDDQRCVNKTNRIFKDPRNCLWKLQRCPGTGTATSSNIKLHIAYFSLTHAHVYVFCNLSL